MFNTRFVDFSRISFSGWHNLFKWSMWWIRLACFLLAVLTYPHFSGIIYDYFLFFVIAFFHLHVLELGITFMFVNFAGVERERSFWNYFNDVRMILATIFLAVIYLLMLMERYIPRPPEDVFRDYPMLVLVIRFTLIGSFLGTFFMNIADFLTGLKK